MMIIEKEIVKRSDVLRCLGMCETELFFNEQ